MLYCCILDSLDHPSLEEFTPKYTGRLDDNQTDCEYERRNPEVIMSVSTIIFFQISVHFWLGTLPPPNCHAMKPLFGVHFSVGSHADDGVVPEVIEKTLCISQPLGQIVSFKVLEPLGGIDCWFT